MALPFSSSSPVSPPTLLVHRRGGQPGNQNARKIGTFSRYQPGRFAPTHTLLLSLNTGLKFPSVPLAQVIEQARTARQALYHPAPTSWAAELHAVQMGIKLSSVISRAIKPLCTFTRRANALETLARDPFSWLLGGCSDSGIRLDADSFFPVSFKTTFNSPFPPAHPNYATNLTDSQWAILAPLIPPDPPLDWLTGEPPIIIAANR